MHPVAEDQWDFWYFDIYLATLFLRICRGVLDPRHLGWVDALTAAHEQALREATDRLRADPDYYPPKYVRIATTDLRLGAATIEEVQAFFRVIAERDFPRHLL